MKILSTPSIQVLVLSLFLVSCDGNKSTQVLGQSLQSFSCPENFVPIPALKGYTKNDFCVMKYEAKNTGAFTRGDGTDDFSISTAEGPPWTYIDRTDAITKCQTMGTGYDLISNNEWQSIARNIELVESNWSTGIVGDGGLNQGHSDRIPLEALAASGDDNKACEGTGQTCNSTTWNSQRRTHTLSNGEVIWDIAGNVFEWVKGFNLVFFRETIWISLITDKNIGELFNLNGDKKTAKGHFGPSGDYSNLNTSPWGGLGSGMFGQGGDRGSEILRSSDYSSGLSSGVFTTQLDMQEEYTEERIGFRCTFHPPPLAYIYTWK